MNTAKEKSDAVKQHFVRTRSLSNRYGEEAGSRMAVAPKKQIQKELGMSDQEFLAIARDLNKYSEVFFETSTKIRNLAIRGLNKKVWKQEDEICQQLENLAKRLKRHGTRVQCMSLAQVAKLRSPIIAFGLAIEYMEKYKHVVGDKPL